MYIVHLHLMILFREATVLITLKYNGNFSLKKIIHVHVYAYKYDASASIDISILYDI